MKWSSQAPANIALIKYMGKQDKRVNLPDNASLSYTLDHLYSTVNLEIHDETYDTWEPFDNDVFFSLSINAQQRFLNHLNYLKAYFKADKFFFTVRSTNNFPQATGLASSASSFAALTKCATIALSELTQKPLLTNSQQANLSRLGSGSSCRSFYNPWALWEADQVTAIDIPYSQLIHQAIIISHKPKQVSSSQAHQYVKTSPNYFFRINQVNQHLQQLLEAFSNLDWYRAYCVCWQEFESMHQLFHSSTPSFNYITAETAILLAKIKQYWQKHNDGPLVTMDAGPNVHLLYRSEQRQLADDFKLGLLQGYHVL